MSSELAKSQISALAVDALERLKGTHPGYRRAHARGLSYDATFTPNGAASPFTVAAHLQNTPVKATVRFSHTDGNPETGDDQKAVRGFATKFHLADGTNTDLVTVNVPRFVASTPESFLEFANAASDDIAAADPNLAHIKAFVGFHPESGPALAGAVALPSPISYATATYWAIHAFLWRNADGQVRPVKYAWIPDAGNTDAAAEDVTGWSHLHLTDELRERLGNGPVGFTLRVQFGEEGDVTNDSTQTWPDERETIDVGRLEITAEAADQEHWESQVFDPTLLTDGIEVSDDPILAARSTIYAVSYDRRIHKR